MCSPDPSQASVRHVGRPAEPAQGDISGTLKKPWPAHRPSSEVDKRSSPQYTANAKGVHFADRRNAHAPVPSSKEAGPVRHAQAAVEARGAAVGQQTRRPGTCHPRAGRPGGAGRGGRCGHPGRPRGQGLHGHGGTSAAPQETPRSRRRTSDGTRSRRPARSPAETRFPRRAWRSGLLKRYYGGLLQKFG